MTSPPKYSQLESFGHIFGYVCTGKSEAIFQLEKLFGFRK